MSICEKAVVRGNSNSSIPLRVESGQLVLHYLDRSETKWRSFVPEKPIAIDEALGKICDFEQQHMAWSEKSNFACTTACAYLQLHNTSWTVSKSDISTVNLCQWNGNQQGIDRGYPMFPKRFQASPDVMNIDDGACAPQLLRSIAVVLLEIWHQSSLHSWLQNRQQGHRQIIDMSGHITTIPMLTKGLPGGASRYMSMKGDVWLAPWTWFNETGHTLLPDYRDAWACCLDVCENLGQEGINEETERRLCKDFLIPLIRCCSF